MGLRRSPSPYFFFLFRQSQGTTPVQSKEAFNPPFRYPENPSKILSIISFWYYHFVTIYDHHILNHKKKYDLQNWRLVSFLISKPPKDIIHAASNLTSGGASPSQAWEKGRQPVMLIWCDIDMNYFTWHLICMELGACNSCNMQNTCMTSMTCL